MRFIVHEQESTSKWNATLASHLERAAYALNDESTVLEICARTALTRLEVTNVLEGNRDASIEALYRISAMLNIPAADLINPTNTVIQCYSIDGGRSRTISLTQDDRALIEHLGNLPLMYADGVDESYALIPKCAFVVFVNRFETPIANHLYLCESGINRYLRRCVGTEVNKHTAMMTDDFDGKGRMSNIKYSKLSSIGQHTEMILGRVLYSITAH